MHQQNGRVVNAVLVEIQDGDEQIAHDIALHIASSRPPYLSRADIPAEILDAERDTLEVMSRNEGKPEAALEKIVDGRMNGFFRDNALLEQKFIKDEKKTIVDLLAGASINRFSQVEIGS